MKGSLKISSLLIILTVLLAMQHILFGMEVRAKSNWLGITEIQASFSQDECEKLANSSTYAWEKTVEMCNATKKVIELNGPGPGLGIIKTILKAGVRVKIARDIQNKSQEMIREYGKPISWTYSFKPNLLGEIIGF